MSLKDFALNTAWYMGGFTAAEMTGITSIIKPSDSSLVKYAKTGALFSAVEELINYLRYGTTPLLNGDYLGTLDNAYFNTVSWAVLDYLGVVSRVWNAAEQFGLPEDLAVPLGSSVIKVSLSTLQDLLNAYGGDSQFQYLTRMISKLVNMNN